MKVQNTVGETVEIPHSRFISPFAHTTVGDLVPVTHQWPENVVVHCGWDPSARNYCVAAYYYGGEVFFPLTEQGDRFRDVFSEAQES